MVVALPLVVTAQHNTGIVGIVLDARTRRPIEDVVVAVPSLNRATSTDTSGRFRLADLKAGNHDLIVRRLGYSPYTERVAIAAGQTLELELFVRNVPVLDSVVVKASRYLRSLACSSYTRGAASK
jgi:hypothetical protein